MKTWYVSHSQESYTLVCVEINPLWWALDIVGSFVTHTLGRFLPTLPIPVVHFGECPLNEKESWHIHNPYKWWGWNMESFLCVSLCNACLFKRMDEERCLLEIPITKEEAKKLAPDFVEGIRETKKE